MQKIESKVFRITMPLAIVILFSLAAEAQLELPAIFSDHMVLQQKDSVAIWGWAAKETNVQIQASWEKKMITAEVKKDGSWMTKLPTIAAGGPYTLKVSSADKTITLTDIYLGEVWLASGQSNMEFFVGKHGSASYNGVIYYEEEIKKANYPLIRMIDVPNHVANEPTREFDADWKICSPQTVDTFSAVAYYFAKDLFEHTGYPIGIINATWGGTPAEAWIDSSWLEKDSVLAPILTRYEIKKKTETTEMQQYEEALAKWKKTNGPDSTAPQKPKFQFYRDPSRLYNGMIAAIEPFSLRGVIWYQGENNASRGWQYRYLFPTLIRNWRSDWHNDTLPFYFVQISPHRSQYPDIREAQFMTYRLLDHTGMAVTTDNGDSLNIHPRNKKLVGERLARWALHDEYGEKDLVPSGPLYRSYQKKGNKFLISFDFATGLHAKSDALTEFTIAGEDSVFVPANARVLGNKLEVWSDAVTDPISVRFAWRNVPEPNLYNAAGLPASPFRTDDWPAQTYGKK